MDKETNVAIKKATAANIRALRRKNNLSQEKLAIKLGVSTKTVNSWERQKATPRLDYLSKMAELFEVPLTDLYCPASDVVFEYKKYSDAEQVVGDTRKLVIESLASEDGSLAKDDLSSAEELKIAINLLKLLDPVSLKYAKRMLLGLLADDTIPTESE